MNNYKKEMQNIEPSEKAMAKLYETAEKASAEKPKKSAMPYIKAFFASPLKRGLSIAVAAVLFLTVGVSVARTINIESKIKNYADIYRLMSSADGDVSGIFYNGDLAKELVYSMQSGTESAAPDRSETNEQVQGVAEGYKVKTDGEYIYCLSSYGYLNIYKASGAETEHLSETAFTELYDADIYLYGNKLVIIGFRSINAGNSFFYYRYRNITDVIVLDVSDKTEPAVLKKFSQSGYLVDSRLTDGKLLAVSFFSGYRPDEKELESYIPFYDGVPAPLERLIAPRAAYGWTCIGIYDLETLERSSDLSILGDSDTVYCTEKNLYVASALYKETSGNEALSGWDTEITKYSFEDGILEKEAVGKIEGTLLNQYSLDEYDGYLRVVANSNIWGYEYGIYVSRRFSSVFVLDNELKTVGKIGNVAENEFVKSVRFDGDIGYFVTFRNTDPLFSVDLSNPEKPEILGALKIPGFSQYMHLWGDDLLLGIGYDADIETGGTRGLKLSMFDTSDKTNVTEKDKSVFGNIHDFNSEYRSYMISPEKNLIGFTAEEWTDGEIYNGGTVYLIFGYSEEDGFKLIKKFDINDIYRIATGMAYEEDLHYYCDYDSVSGIYIGENIYLVGDYGVAVYSMTDMTKIAEVTA